MQASPTLVSAQWLITPTPNGVRIIEAGALVWGADGTLLEVGTANDLAGQYPQASRIDLPQHLLAPGLVNAHCHAAMSLLRGAADDLPLERWLQERIWPMESRLVDPLFVQTGTQLAIAEMLLGGTTTCADMYFYPEDSARAFLQWGMRACLTMTVADFPTPYAAGVDDYLSKGLAARDRFAEEPLLSFALAPHAPYSASDTTFAQVQAYADELGLPVQTHVQETAQEVIDSLAQYHERPTARLARLGILGPDFSAAHGVHLNAEDIATFARFGASVVHCPSSNLKLASGIAPVAEMLAAGVNVGLGTDGAASNNRLDLFEEMRLAALLGKVKQNDASAINAHQAFTMATLGGARALGLGNVTGSLEVGKKADVIALSLQAPNLQPLYDPISHFVYAASSANVSHVWVNGRNRVENATLAPELAAAMAELGPEVSNFAARVRTQRN